MFNLIKMNIYRVTHMKSFIVLPVIMFVLCFFSVLITASAGSAEDIEADIDVSVSEQDDDNTLSGLIDSLTAGGLAAMLIGIGAAFVTVTDYKNGYIKNYAGQVSPKGIGPIAKIPAVILESAVIYGAGILAFILFGNSMISGFSAGSVPDIFKVMGMHFLLSAALGSFIIFVTNLFRSSVPSIIIIMYMFLLSNSITGLINFLCVEHLNFPEKFDFGVITIERYIMGVTSQTPAKFIGYAAIASFAYIIISSAASFLITKKRDI